MTAWPGGIAAIIVKGVDQFRSLGTPGNSGTKVFSISGDVARVGVVEVPLGTTVRELLALAGGVTGGSFKAAQTGGASGFLSSLGSAMPPMLDVMKSIKKDDVMNSVRVV